MGNRLKELRKAKGLTLDELSKELKNKYELPLSTGQLSSYENGKRSPREENTWRTIAEYFKVPISYLLGYDDKLTIGDAIDILNAVSAGTVSPDNEIAKKIIESQNRTIVNAKITMEQNYEKTKGFDLISNVRFLSLLIENYDKVFKDILFYIAPRIEKDELTDIEIKALEDFIKLFDSHFGDHQDDVVYTHDFIHEFLKQKTTPTDND